MPPDLRPHPPHPPDPPIVDLDGLGLDRGGHLLLSLALAPLRPGQAVVVRGDDPHLALHLRTWARERGHRADGLHLVKGSAPEARWSGSARAGRIQEPSAVAELSWGLAARGALLEAGGPELAPSRLREKSHVWVTIATKLYAQAAANQWDPAKAIDWTIPTDLPDIVEDAVIQVMTFLIENEQAALQVPVHHLTQIHPHFREIIAFMATQVADEARHIEVFTRRAQLHRDELGTSTVAGRESLQTLLDEPDFSLACLLLSVLGEGSFLDLLAFLVEHAPDPLTRRIAQLVAQDEARHVAFGQAHLEFRVGSDPGFRGAVETVIRARHEALQSSSGLNADVHDALVLLAARALDPESIGRGWDLVATLEQDMETGRTRRLVRLGFAPDEARELARLHTRNFM